jgi:hypothetical protein
MTHDDIYDKPMVKSRFVLCGAAGSECPSGDEWIPCQAENGDPMAMYVMGRRAYEEARTSGDFTAALNWSRKLVAAKEKNGERLLKMVYIQMGWGAHRDYVQAYMWLDLSSAGEEGFYAVGSRSEVAAKMTPGQILQAQRLVDAWKANRSK